MELVVLEELRVPEPCHADWGAMAGDDTRRFCPGCQKHVHNLSAMSRREAESLLAERCGDLCIRMSQADDGRVLTDERPAPVRMARRAFVILAGRAAATAAGFAGLLGVARRSRAAQKADPRATMGEPVARPNAAAAKGPATSPPVPTATMGKPAASPVTMGTPVAPKDANAGKHPVKLMGKPAVPHHGKPAALPTERMGRVVARKATSPPKPGGPK